MIRFPKRIIMVYRHSNLCTWDPKLAWVYWVLYTVMKYLGQVIVQNTSREVETYKATKRRYTYPWIYWLHIWQSYIVKNNSGAGLPSAKQSEGTQVDQYIVKLHTVAFHGIYIQHALYSCVLIMLLATIYTQELVFMFRKFWLFYNNRIFNDR